jgi:valyl-tRNA synthetase
MRKKELAKTYDPSAMEDQIYRNWEEKGYFHAKVNPDRKPFTIVMPPPNVTGQLHMGHALDNTLQDILRIKCSRGIVRINYNYAAGLFIYLG